MVYFFLYINNHDYASDSHLDAEHSLSEQDVSAGHVHILVDGVSGVDHQTINKLHGLGSLSSQLARHNNLTSLGARLHDETEMGYKLDVSSTRRY